MKMNKDYKGVKSMKIDHNQSYRSISRRSLLKWTTPAVAAVTLPVHAQTSFCTSAIVVASVSSPSKCSGNPPVGNAVISLVSDTPMVDVVIDSITVTGAGADDSVSFASLPQTVSDMVGLDVTWQGPASDAQTCLPLSTISLSIGFSCEGDPAENELVIELTPLLASAIP